MKTLTTLSLLALSFNTLATLRSYKGIISGSATKEDCYLQTDLSEHKMEIDFFSEQRKGYGTSETLESQKQYGEDKISLVIAKGQKEQNNITRRPKYQPAEPTAAIDREFLASPGAVFVGHYLKTQNLSYLTKKGPKEYALQVNLKELLPTSYEFKASSKEASFNCVNLKPLVSK
jgi:hypothetical protein